MAKTSDTRKIELQLLRNRHKGVIGGLEVGFGEHGIVDYCTFSPNSGELSCYEIKVTMADLRSKNKLTWIGDYNYLVIPRAIWDAHRDAILAELDAKVGIVIADLDYYRKNGNCLKSARRAVRSPRIPSKVEILRRMAASFDRKLTKKELAEG